MKLTKEVAELMYKSEDESVRAFALSNYPELGVKNLVWNPKEEKLEDVDLFILPDMYYPTRELYEAAEVPPKLLQERDRYNGDWKADWTDVTRKYAITVYENKINKDLFCGHQRVMYFKTAELRNLFLENFRDLLEIAKPLL